MTAALPFEPAPSVSTPTLFRVADSTPGWLAGFDAEHRCFYANRAFAETVAPDQPRRTLIGRTLAELMGQGWFDRHADTLRSVIEQRACPRFECDWQPLATAQAQRLRWIEVILTPHLSPKNAAQGYFLQVHDLTHHHALESALLESEERLARFSHASLEGIVFHDHGRVVDANPAACELLDRRLHELIHQPWLDLVTPEHRSELQQRLSGTDVVSMETVLVTAPGSTLPIDLVDRPTLVDGRLMRVAVLRDASDRHATQQHIDYLAHHDVLTGLPNRHAIVVQLEHLMQASQAADTLLALLFIDLDHFMRVNDSVGHTAGDQVLKIIAKRVQDRLRSSDWVARFGGDEFMVLLPGMRDQADVLRVADKLADCIALPIHIDGRPISVTASIGVAVFPQHGQVPQRLLQHADAAMHVAKARGRATVAVFEEAVAQSAYDRLVLEGQLGHAIEHEEFALLFQPQVRTRDQKVVGVEALIRWQHPERGLLAPDEFIALAEQHRLIVPIGNWVLAEAARCARLWHAAGHAITVAVNLSTLQFQASDFVDIVADLLDSSGLPSGWLELELTERMLMDDVPAVRSRLLQLRALGVRLSVDDFGTGYSSLGHIKELPIDKMKIDRSFVKELSSDPRSQAIARTIVELARGLGLTAVAEGVETPVQCRILRALNCDQVQGMGVCPPLNAQDLQLWLERYSSSGERRRDLDGKQSPGDPTPLC